MLFCLLLFDWRRHCKPKFSIISNTSFRDFILNKLSACAMSFAQWFRGTCHETIFSLGLSLNETPLNTLSLKFVYQWQLFSNIVLTLGDLTLCLSWRRSCQCNYSGHSKPLLGPLLVMKEVILTHKEYSFI